MSLPYRTRRRLQRLGSAALTIVTLLAIVWLAGVVYLERDIIYTRDGAVLDPEKAAEMNQWPAVEAVPPATDETIPIFYNEGENAISMNADLTRLWGYYISYEDLTRDIAGCRENLAKLEPGTPVMIELKSRYGYFHYSTEVAGAHTATNINIPEVDALIQDLTSRNLYAIARISSFRDQAYGLNNVNQGIFHTSGAYLWADTTGCYWLDPTKPAVISYLTSIVQELKGMGFDEVLLADFNIPASEKAKFNGDRTQALVSAAETMLKSCGNDYFTLSFGVSSSTFPLPEGRCRMYLESVSAQNVGATVAQATVSDPEIRIVFLSDANDTRFDDYGILRPLSASEVLGDRAPNRKDPADGGE